MSQKHKKASETPSDVTVTQETTPEEGIPAGEAASAAEQTDPLQETLKTAQLALAAKEEQYLRLAAEYDNFRKRTAKEREATWADSKMETVKAFLPVYDNLSRALKQETADTAYAKGVEMTMNQLNGILEKLSVAEIPALGAVFDPNLHNAVMHVEDESVAENTIVEVFEPGFTLDEKIIRFAMVKVAN
ncbi:MAG: nucleotide exchange factor GrpE [Oscillospiraceae bacterium]|nr:nucleotide exchange factor GrpE [Oscillospiraceae bacterium]